jgi:hypothetical protein
MITESFRSDLIFFQEKIKNDEPFALTRFGDGEYKIIKDQPIDLIAKKEFKFDGEKELRQELIDSFTYNAPGYYVGIACACCAGNELFNAMKQYVKVPNLQLTWANIFVNGNYNYFKNNFVETLKTKKVNLIAPGNHSNLSFATGHNFNVGPNAWVEQADLRNILATLIKEKKITNQIFIFCAGPFANILCQQLFSLYPQNTYIDVGSVFNIELGIGANRNYLKGKKNLSKICQWEEIIKKKSKFDFLRLLK